MVEPKREQRDEDLYKLVAKGLAVAGALFVVALGFYLAKFHGGLSPEQEHWGQFGDFLGGTLNPVFGFFSVVLLAFTLQAQHRVLAETRKQAVLEELQRLVATTSQRLDELLDQQIVGAAGSLQSMVQGLYTGDAAKSIPPSVGGEMRLGEYLREIASLLWDRRIRDDKAFRDARGDRRVREVQRQVSHLDECLSEFRAQGGDPVIAHLYGKRYSEIIVYVCAVHPPFDARIPFDPADMAERFGLGDLLTRFVAEVLAVQDKAHHFEEHRRGIREAAKARREQLDPKSSE